MTKSNESNQPENKHHSSGSALNCLVSLQDVNAYFYQDADEACEEYTDAFVDRVIDDGFDPSVDEHLRYLIVIWALADPGDAAGKACHAVLRRLSAS